MLRSSIDCCEGRAVLSPPKKFLISNWLSILVRIKIHSNKGKITIVLSLEKGDFDGSTEDFVGLICVKKYSRQSSWDCPTPTTSSTGKDTWIYVYRYR
jgi:hypothetical protein